ncbi:hypothetical protein TREES_T100003159 [Tupaia chinensis]|uniref:Uncharacterized protein n=1 Tax=Tupaia chinensis TaxID=246437 RepID=L9KHS9_TUPCH|nr:hypothetical protein TREES_T100003159 [Tupaia chinensis]
MGKIADIVNRNLETIEDLRCQPTDLPVLVDWLGNPLGVSVFSDSFMEWINEDNLEEFVCGIFTHPVRIQDRKSPTVASSSLLCNRLEAASKLELVNTMMDRLAIGCILGDWVFAASTPHTNPVYHVTELHLVAQSACFILLGGAGRSVQAQRRELAVLPAADPQ